MHVIWLSRYLKNAKQHEWVCAMSGLRLLQESFHHYVIKTDVEQIAAQIVSTESASAETRLGIYSSAYRIRLQETLQSDYPKLHFLLGDEAFAKLTLRYIDAHPSNHPSLRWFGSHMPDYLSLHEPYKDQSVLSEMARFEWTQSGTFDAHNQNVLGLNDIASVAPEDWGRMRFVLHPSVHRLNLVWNVPGMWSHIDEGQSNLEPVAVENPIGWVLWRKDMRIHWRSLEVDEACCLDGCFKGRDFSELCEILCEWIDEENVAVHAVGLLKRWVEDDMLSQLVVN